MRGRATLRSRSTTFRTWVCMTVCTTRRGARAAVWRWPPTSVTRPRSRSPGSRSRRAHSMRCRSPRARPIPAIRGFCPSLAATTVSATGSNGGSPRDRQRRSPDEETPLEPSEAFGAALGDEDGLAEGHAAGPGVHVEDHAGLQHPLRGGHEGPGEVAGPRWVRRAVVAERVAGEVVIALA